MRYDQGSTDDLLADLAKGHPQARRALERCLRRLQAEGPTYFADTIQRIQSALEMPK